MTISLAILGLMAACSAAYALRCFQLQYRDAHRRADKYERLWQIECARTRDLRADLDDVQDFADEATLLLGLHAEAEAKRRHPASRLAVVK